MLFKGGRHIELPTLTSAELRGLLNLINDMERGEASQIVTECLKRLMDALLKEDDGLG